MFRARAMGMSGVPEAGDETTALHGPSMRRSLDSWHIFFIIVSVTIGVGLFDNSGEVLSVAGPSGGLLAFLIVGFYVLCIMDGVAEMISHWPISNAMFEFVKVFIDDDLAVILGIGYWYAYSASFSTLIFAASNLFRYWEIGNGLILLTILITALVLSILNLFGVKMYGMITTGFGFLKLLVVIGSFLFMCIIAGRNSNEYIQDGLKSNPVVASNHTTAVILAISSTVYAYIGVEVIAVVGLEVKNPGKSLKYTAKYMPIFVFILYFVVTLSFYLNVSWTDPKLPSFSNNISYGSLNFAPSNSSSESQTTSILLIAIINAGFNSSRYPDFLNGCLLLVVLSAANTTLYIASRTLFGLTRTISRTGSSHLRFLVALNRITAAGVPAWAVITSAVSFVWLPFVRNDAISRKINEFISGTAVVAVVLVWASQCVVFLKYRHWLKKNQTHLVGVYQQFNTWQKFQEKNPPFRGFLGYLQPMPAWLGLGGCFLTVFLIPTIRWWHGGARPIQIIAAFILPFVYLIVWLAFKLINRRRWRRVRHWEQVKHCLDILSAQVLDQIEPDCIPDNDLNTDLNQEARAEILLDSINTSAWIYTKPGALVGPAAKLDFHQPVCVHSGGDAIPQSTKVSKLNSIDINQGAPSSTSGTDMVSISNPQFYVEQCGIAGVYPLSQGGRDWIGTAKFEGNHNSEASVTYKLPAREIADAEKDDQSLASRPLIQRLLDALAIFSGAAGQMQKQGLCCSSFTILRFSNVHKAAELCTLQFAVASRLRNCLEELDRNGESFSKRDECLALTHEVINVALGNTKNNESSSADLSVESILNACSLAVQILSLGLYLYSQAHIGVVHPSFLREPLKLIHLFGDQNLENIKRQVSVTLVKLTCMGEMLRDRVMVFGPAILKPWGLRKSTTIAYDLLASAEDIVDTWGGSQFLMDPTSPYGEKLYGVKIRGGLIKPVGGQRPTGSQEDSSPPVRYFHWARDSNDQDALVETFHFRTKILIGTTTENRQCPVDKSHTWNEARFSTSASHLGPRRPFFQETERQTGIQGGQYVNVVFNSTRTLQPGQTLKENILIQLDIPLGIYLPVLEYCWGLQLSFCTGVARRVPIRELLAEAMPAFVEAVAPKPVGWTALKGNHDIVSAFKSSDLEKWLDDLPSDLQQLVVTIVRQTLNALRDTGIDQSGKQLLLAYPRKDNPFLCMALPCRSENLFARILKDSQLCATFACITEVCLVTSDHPCRQAQVPHWLNKCHSIDTEVSPYSPIAQVPRTVTNQWNLINKRSYLMGDPAFRVRANIINTHSSLIVSGSIIPERYLAAWRRIQERMNIEHLREGGGGVVAIGGLIAQRVVILTKPVDNRTTKQRIWSAILEILPSWPPWK